MLASEVGSPSTCGESVLNSVLFGAESTLTGMASDELTLGRVGVVSSADMPAKDAGMLNRFASKRCLHGLGVDVGVAEMFAMSKFLAYHRIPGSHETRLDVDRRVRDNCNRDPVRRTEAVIRCVTEASPGELLFEGIDGALNIGVGIEPSEDGFPATGMHA